MFEIQKREPGSRARTGRLKTAHGDIETPAYVVVGTYGSVRCLEPEDIPRTKTQLIIANTYHLWRSLGDEGLNNYPGLHEAMEWNGPLMTDSGGFQVFSLGALKTRQQRNLSPDENGLTNSGSDVRVTESGVYFRAGDEGEEEYLDAELSVKIQEQLGSDIIVAFDEPTSPAESFDHTKRAMERTHAWGLRSLEAKQSPQALYGVVQGGAYEELRRASAEHIGGLAFDGFAIGSTYGDAYGGTKAMTKNMLEWSIPYLPESKPRHLFGVGRIEDLFDGVAAGIDTFDCVIPTREGRHGRVWTLDGHIDITKGRYGDDDGLLGDACDCPVCRGDLGASRGDLHHMFRNKDPRGARYASIHNIFFFNDLMEQMRNALRSGQFGEFREKVANRAKRVDT